MKFSEIRELARLRPLSPDHDQRVVARCHDVADLRRAARRRLPRPVFGYVDGGADDEVTLRANRAALLRWRLRPRVLRDVAEPDLRVSVLGADLAAPIGLAPTGFTRLVHQAGELAAARAAAARGLPYCLSTVGTTTIEDVAQTGLRDRWFQLYVLRDREIARELIERAAKAGYRALEVTVDAPVSGRRTRDLRNGLTMPPTLTPRALLEVAARPGYWVSLLRGPALRYASFTPPAPESGTTIADIISMFDASLTWDDVEEFRALWPGQLLLKGPLGPADAVRAVAAGVDGIHLSNHGGRQLDRCVPTIDLVRPVREAVGDQAAIVLDSGIRHGGDVAVAIARGADLCMVGRSYLYGLAAAGQPGVEHAIDLLVAQLRRTMQLLGVTTIAELREHGDELVVPATA